MIVENKYFKDIKRIWKDNNSGFITEESNEMLIKNNDILKIVYLENEIPAGQQYILKMIFVNQKIFQIKQKKKEMYHIYGKQ